MSLCDNTTANPKTTLKLQSIRKTKTCRNAWKMTLKLDGVPFVWLPCFFFVLAFINLQKRQNKNKMFPMRAHNRIIIIYLFILFIYLRPKSVHICTHTQKKKRKRNINPKRCTIEKYKFKTKFAQNIGICTK